MLSPNQRRKAAAAAATSRHHQQPSRLNGGPSYYQHQPPPVSPHQPPYQHQPQQVVAGRRGGPVMVHQNSVMRGSAENLVGMVGPLSLDINLLSFCHSVALISNPETIQNWRTFFIKKN